MRLVLRTLLRIARHGENPPAKPSRGGIVSGYGTARPLEVRPAVADDDEITCDERRARNEVMKIAAAPRLEGIGLPDQTSARGVERMQIAVQRSDIHPAPPHR